MVQPSQETRKMKMMMQWWMVPCRWKGKRWLIWGGGALWWLSSSEENKGEACVGVQLKRQRKGLCLEFLRKWKESSMGKGL